MTESRQARRARARKPAPDMVGPTTSRDLTQEWVARRTKPLPSGDVTELVLPSGDAVKARRLPLAALLQMGQIPNRLMPVVLEWAQAFQAAGDDFEAGAHAISAKIQADLQSFVQILGHVWRACVVEPRFVEDDRYLGEPGTLPMMWVGLDDLQYLFDWAQGVDESVVAWFRRRQGAGLAPVAPGEGNGNPSESPPRDQPDPGPVVGVAVGRGR